MNERGQFGLGHSHLGSQESQFAADHRGTPKHDPLGDRLVKAIDVGNRYAGVAGIVDKHLRALDDHIVQSALGVTIRFHLTLHTRQVYSSAQMIVTTLAHSRTASGITISRTTRFPELGEPVSIEYFHKSGCVACSGGA